MWNRERKCRFEPKRKKADIVTSYKRNKKALKWAPCAWLRNLAAIIEKNGGWVMVIEEVGVWFYAMYSTFTSAIYVGPTGGVREPRAIVERFVEEVNEANGDINYIGSRAYAGCGPPFFKWPPPPPPIGGGGGPPPMGGGWGRLDPGA